MCGDHGIRHTEICKWVSSIQRAIEERDDRMGTGASARFRADGRLLEILLLSDLAKDGANLRLAISRFG